MTFLIKFLWALLFCIPGNLFYKLIYYEMFAMFQNAGASTVWLRLQQWKLFLWDKPSNWTAEAAAPSTATGSPGIFRKLEKLPNF